MQSRSIGNRMIDRFDLMAVYEEKYRQDALKQLSESSRFFIGKKDGLVRVEVDDTNPKRAAEMANAYLEELKQLSSGLALTEAQQRRSFFEGQLEQTRERLGKAQRQLESSGISQGALRAEPKAAAESYAKARAELTAAEIRLQALLRSMTESTPEVQSALAVVASLRQQLAKVESTAQASGQDADYINRYREFKYQEALFEVFSRQYEMARADEARDGGLFQVIDAAAIPERKSGPKRSLIALVVVVLTFFSVVVAVTIRAALKRSTPLRATI
jgi:uncharacterized protein involved in exopolysaccharide biosynthesis